MIETVQSTTSDAFDLVAGEVAVQYDRLGPDIGIGLTLRRAPLVTWLADQPTDTDTVQLYARLQRPSANRLIRLLRKARDVAFGADE